MHVVHLRNARSHALEEHLETAGGEEVQVVVAAEEIDLVVERASACEMSREPTRRGASG